MPPDRVAEVWPWVLPHVEAALRHGAGEYLAIDVRGYCEAGTWQLWIATRPGELIGAALTEVVDYPRRRILFLHLAGAQEGEALAPLWEMARRWARDLGCDAMRFVGRPGWQRTALLPPGGRLEQVSMVIPVEAEA